MRLSRERIVHLSHQIVDYLDRNDKVELSPDFDSNDIRLEIFDVLKANIELDDHIAKSVREKIRSMKKDIPEGSQEWDVLVHKYTEEEWEKRRSIS